MTGAVLSIVLDVLVLICLSITIFYAIKLTNSLNAFRQARQEFNNIMRELTKNVSEAQRGIENLKTASRESGQNLQKIINDSRKIAQELIALNQTSEHRLAEAILDDPAIFEEFEEEAGGGEAFDFFIQDREAALGREPEVPANFQSKAERDLYETLQKSRKTGRGAA